MFVVGEGGQAIGREYTWEEAIYVPLAAYITRWLLGVE